MVSVPGYRIEQPVSGVAEPRRLRHRAPDVDAPRPLQPKATALLTRKRQRHRLNAASSAGGSTVRACGSVELSSEDGAIAYVLRRVSIGLSVARTQRRQLDTHVIQSLVFFTLQEFDRWCASDPVRFEYPILHEKLRRAGNDLLANPI